MPRNLFIKQLSFLSVPARVGILLALLLGIFPVTPGRAAYAGAGYALDLDGTNDWVQVTGVDSFSPFTLSGGSPTSAGMAAFSATSDGDGILLAWETASELDTLGFNLYRAASLHGSQIQLNQDLIAAQMPGSPAGAAYTHLDETVAPGATYYYWLEDVDIWGAPTRHGPVPAVALASLPYRTYLPMVSR